MKMILMGLIALLSITSNGQEMNLAQETVTKLFIATDQRDWDVVRECFHDLVILDYSSMNGNPVAKLSPQQIIASWKGILPGFTATHHQLGNMVSSYQNDTAELFCYGTANHFLEDPAGNLWTVVGTYDFKLLEVQKGIWKISSMKFNFKYQDGNTTLPDKAINKLK